MTHATTTEPTAVTPATWAEHYRAAQSVLLAGDAVVNGAVYPHWIDNDRFWYRRTGDAGVEYCLVEAATGDRRILFTQAAVAEALAPHRNASVDAIAPILGHVDIDPGLSRALFTAFDTTYAYALADGSLTPATRPSDPDWAVSPDGRLAIVVRDHNLYVRDIATGGERAATNDGTGDNAYAEKPGVLRRRADELGWPAPPEGRSPDSTRFLTLQVDERHMLDLPVIDFVLGRGVRPTVSTNRASLPGDSRVTEFRPIVLDVETGHQTEARYPRLTAVRMNDTPFSADLAWWAADSRTAYFVDIERGERAAHAVAFDVVTGATRVIFTETADTYVELGVDVYGPALVHPLPDTDELVWYSERSGHGHLYLYDLSTGRLKNAITSGPWQVRDLLNVDPARREVFFTAGGIALDDDPYLRRPCVAALDGGPVTVVSAEAGDHIVWRSGESALLMLAGDGDDARAISGVSPDGRHFVETVGAADRLPHTVLRRRDGDLVAELEVGRDRRLPIGWTWPEPVTLTAADGRTATYGLLFTPWDYDPAQSYPLIDFIYGGPQSTHVPKSAFANSGNGTDMQYLDAAHLSALGAFVLVLDGRGTAGRERAFRETSYAAIHTASDIDDHIAGIRELAARWPAIDLDRVGICGFSGGGYATALAALRHGDFFKVAVAGGGNYDQSLFWHTWGERYHGRYDPEQYRAQAVRTYASGLIGKLLLIHGLLDSGCHPAALFQLVQALIEQNKDVDLVLLPREGHQLNGYGVRRRLDYFVTHLFGSTPPHGVTIATAAERKLGTRHEERA